LFTRVGLIQGESIKVKYGELINTINEVKSRLTVDDDVTLFKIRQRYFRQNINIDHNHGGHVSPMAVIEDTAVNIAIQMAGIRQSLNPSRGLALINSLIRDRPIQGKLIEWKTKFCNDELGAIGVGYCQQFLKRQCDKILGKRGQKYELDCHKWTTYANFFDMYQHTI